MQSYRIKAEIRGREIAHAYLDVHAADWQLADWQRFYRELQDTPTNGSRVKKFQRRATAEIISGHIHGLIALRPTAAVA